MLNFTRRDVMISGTSAALLLQSGAVSALAQASAAKPAGPMWNLSEIFPSDAAWEAKRKEVLARIPQLARYKGTLGQSPSALGTALQAISDVNRETARLYTYASLKGDEDLKLSPNQERRQQALDIYTALGEATSWVDPELVALGKDKVMGLVAANPKLAKFRHGLDDILRRAPHTLSPQGEKLLASATSPLAGPENIRDQLVSSDIPWPTVKLTDGREIRLDNQGYTLARSAPNRADRKKVFDSFWATYKDYENSLGTALASQVQGDLFRAKARNYDSALQASLDSANLPEGVYRTLVAEANRGLPVLHRYFELRRRMLGLPDLGYWDIYPPLVKSTRKYSLDDMRTLTAQAVRPLGSDYVALFNSSAAKSWVDPWPRPGKASGAYMNSSAYDVHPYLLLNLSEEYDGLSTYAHEWGHAMHSLLADSAQPYELSDYPTFTAEVASTAHEMLLANMLVDQAKSRDDKLFFLGQIMENYRGTFYRQAMFGEFQLAINDLATKGDGLSGEKMSALYLDLVRRYHGPNVTILPDYGAEWAYIAHFYYGFYVYQYATSITAANFFAQKVMHGGPADRDRYLAVLRSGGSDYGYNLLKTGGLDMASAEPYRLLIANFSKVLDQAEALL